MFALSSAGLQESRIKSNVLELAAEVSSEPLNPGGRQVSTHQETVVGLGLLCVSLEK